MLLVPLSNWERRLVGAVKCSAGIQSLRSVLCLIFILYFVTELQSATHELGHIPGQEGEQEALATLRLIRECMIRECKSLCRASVPRLFRPIPNPPQPNGEALQRLYGQ